MMQTTAQTIQLPNFSFFDEGSAVMSKEANAALMIRQEKFMMILTKK
jgi:hypothetical protein